MTDTEEPTRGSGAIALIAAPMAFILMLIFVIAMGSSGGANGCLGSPAAGVNGQLPESVGDYSGVQIENAATIMRVANSLQLSTHAQVVAIMTAMGESSLRNIDHGDLALNPDGSMNSSVGMFQQQEWWGPLDVRMDPAGATRLFLERLVTVPGWESMAPTLAANAVQGNQDPYHYERFMAPALEMVEALGGVGACIGGNVSAGGWASPSDHGITSGYGWRSLGDFHLGLDFSGGCGEPYYAAANGIVLRVFEDDYGGMIIEIDHGAGIVAWYVHSYPEDIFVVAGQTVQAGQTIGLEGETGYAFGCHLHFEVRVNGHSVDPLALLQQHGVG